MKQIASIAMSAGIVMAASFPAEARDHGLRGSFERHDRRIMLVADDGCFSIGEDVAKRMGARLLRADEAGGNCQLVLLVPGAPGERPLRKVLTVPRR